LCQMDLDLAPPLKPGAALQGVWGPAEDDVWVAGQETALWHFDGLTWTSPDANAVHHIVAMFGVGKEGWALGGCSRATSPCPYDDQHAADVILHWDGSAARPSWAPESSTPGRGQLWSAGGSDPHDLWAVGDHTDLAG